MRLQQSRRRAGFRPRLLRLEDRLSPAVYTWTGGPSGNGTAWNDPANWSPKGVPGSADDAQLSLTGSNPLIVVSGANVRSVQSSRDLSVTGSFTVGPFTSSAVWILNGGSLHADGATLSLSRVDGPSSFANTSTLTLLSSTINAPFSNSGTLNLSGGGATFALGFTNTGTINLVGSSSNLLLSSGTLTNAAGGTIASVGPAGSQTIHLGNAGAVTLNNLGTLNAAAGLTIAGSGSGQTLLNSGTFTIPTGQTLAVNPDLTWQGGSVSGSGTLYTSNNTLTLAVGLTVTSSFTLMLGNATVVNGPGTLTVAAGGNLITDGSAVNLPINVPVINAGTIVGGALGTSFNGTYTSMANSTIQLRRPTGGGASVSFAAGFVNNGLIEFYNAGDTLLIQSGTLTNAAGRTIHVRPGNAGFRTITLANAATFQNQGSLIVAADLNFYGGGGQKFVNSGSVTIDPGQTLGNGADFQLGGSIGGGGLLDLSFATISLVSGFTLTVGPALSVKLLVTTVDGPGVFSIPAGVTQVASQTTFNGPLSLAGTLNVQGQGVILNGPLTTTAGSVLNVNSFGLSVNTSFTNLGAINLTSDGSSGGTTLLLRNSASLTNSAGGTFTVAAGAGGFRQISIGDGSTLNNLGAFAVNTSVEVQSGPVTNAGTLSVAAGAVLTGFVTNNAGGLVIGNGTIAGGVTGAGKVSPGFSPGLLTVNGNATIGGLIVELNGTNAGTQYDQLVATGTTSLSGPLTATLGYSPTVGDQFIIINNTGASPISGTFAGLPEGASLVIGGLNFTITYVGGTGNDVVLNRVAGVPVPQVNAVQVNDGSAQRSRVTSLQITFNTQVNFAGSVASAFTLVRTGGGAVSFNASASVVNGVTVVLINNFTGTESQFGSLRDGRYTLTALASQISNASGQLNGGSNYTFGDAQGLFRFFGDANGDRRVDIADFGLFSTTYGLLSGQPGYLGYFDFNNDGRVDIVDFGQFSIRYFTTLP
mgnify:CR=1 FL=1